MRGIDRLRHGRAGGRWPRRLGRSGRTCEVPAEVVALVVDVVLADLLVIDRKLDGVEDARLEASDDGGSTEGLSFVIQMRPTATVQTGSPEVRGIRQA
jgi:hypothetical protein